MVGTLLYKALISHAPVAVLVGDRVLPVYDEGAGLPHLVYGLTYAEVEASSGGVTGPDPLHYILHCVARTHAEAERLARRVYLFLRDDAYHGNVLGGVPVAGTRVETVGDAVDSQPDGRPTGNYRVDVEAVIEACVEDVEAADLALLEG